MLIKFNIARAFESAPKKYNACPECGKAKVFKWDSFGKGKNIILTSSNHDDCAQGVKDEILKEVA